MFSNFKQFEAGYTYIFINVAYINLVQSVGKTPHEQQVSQETTVKLTQKLLVVCTLVF